MAPPGRPRRRYQEPVDHAERRGARHGKAAREIAEIAQGRPVSVEVTTNEPDEMLQQARKIARWAPNIVVKIPVINQDGAAVSEVIHAPRHWGIKVNTTAILSFNHVMLGGEGGRDLLQCLRRPGGRRRTRAYGADLLGGPLGGGLALREDPGRERARQPRRPGTGSGGCPHHHRPPAILEKVLDHKYTREMVRGFNAAARKALGKWRSRRARGAYRFRLVFRLVSAWSGLSPRSMRTVNVVDNTMSR